MKVEPPMSGFVGSRRHWMRLENALWLLIAVATLSACLSGEHRSGMTTRDSAGVRITESSAPAWGEEDRWSLSVEPFLSIGENSTDPDHHFQDIAGAVLLSDGRVAVGDRDANLLRIYDSLGRYVRTVGRQGEGPGEFRALQSLTRYSGDSVLAFDRRLQRITVFDDSGRVAFVLPLSLRVIAVRRLPDGAWVGADQEGHFGGRLDERAPVGLVRQPAAVLLLNADGTLKDTLGVFPGAEMAMIRRGERMGSVPAAFGTTFSIGVRGDEIHVGTGDLLGYDVYDSGGRLVRSVRGQGPDRSLDPGEIDRWRAAFLELVPAGAMRTNYAEALELAEAPKQKTAFSRMLVDPEGHTWLSQYEISFLATGAWHVFDPEGRYLGGVQMPASFHTLEIGADYVLGIWRDEMGVQSLRAYRLDRN